MLAVTAAKRLEAKERGNFSNEKLDELDRMSDDRMDAMLNAEEGTADEKKANRAAVIASIAKLSVKQLRSFVNITDFGEPVTISADSDFTKDELDVIGWGWKANRGRRPLEEIPAMLDQNEEMIADGLDAATRKHILKARGA